jgi:ubiquitin-like protein Pup
MSPGQKRETKSRPRTHEHVSSPSDSKSNEQNKQKAKDLAQEMDEILEEIDSVLEQNAEEFVQGYVQKGGQHHRTRNTWFQPHGGTCSQSSLRTQMAGQELGSRQGI